MLNYFCDKCGKKLSPIPADIYNLEHWYTITLHGVFGTKTIDVCPECFAKIPTEIDKAKKL